MLTERRQCADCGAEQDPDGTVLRFSYLHGTYVCADADACQDRIQDSLHEMLPGEV